ncbi:MAG: prepilin-type N-terminal cleavage/methylation domain-containing protein [Nitrospirae bacterium]|nr:prepilin-type N-terminal cleavage/methylation domain-containing protein [Nitrospirota bacterium]
MRKILGGNAGFTIAELLVSMLIVSIMMGAIFASFTTLTSSFKIQTKTAESQIEDVLGLELLRYDLESAGYGLPEGTGGGSCSTITAYSEYPTGFTPTGSTNFTPNQYTPDPATDFNDSTSSCEPRPIVLDHNTNPTPSNSNGSDVLVVKSITADRTAVTKKWTMLDASSHYIKWNDSTWDLGTTTPSDRAIAVTSTRQLVSNGGNFQYGLATGGTASATTTYLPTTPAAGNFYVIYGVNSTTNLRMPFNRVDYYLQRGGTSAPHPYPLQCNPGGYTLYRAVLSHSNGQRVEQPIMDCVIDFQVALGIDTGCTDTLGSGCTGTLTWCRFTNLTSNTASLTPCNSTSDAGCTNDPCHLTTSYLNNAQSIRRYLKQVKVFVLTHEGKIDPNFTYANNSIVIGDSDITLKTYDLTTLTNYANYRWKLQKINVKLNSLGGNYE